DRPEHGAARHGRPVRPRLHGALEPHRARRTARVRPFRRGRIGGLGRPGGRARVRVRHEPDGHRSGRRRPELRADQRVLRRDALTSLNTRVATLPVMDVAPAIDREVPFERIQLDDTSWVDLARGWLRGADQVYEHLVSTLAWRQGRVWRDERWIDEPRLGAGGSIAHPGHPVLADAQKAIAAKYEIGR